MFNLELWSFGFTRDRTQRDNYHVQTCLHRNGSMRIESGSTSPSIQWSISSYDCYNVLIRIELIYSIPWGARLYDATRRRFILRQAIEESGFSRHIVLPTWYVTDEYAYIWKWIGKKSAQWSTLIHHTTKVSTKRLWLSPFNRSEHIWFVSRSRAVERHIVIFSCVRAAGSKGIGFLSDLRRMNVALTRANIFFSLLQDVTRSVSIHIGTSS
jgi:hypothetical protein